MASERGVPGSVSNDAASTTRPTRASRNFDGIVRRPLASSVCSKVPRKGVKAAHPPASRVLVKMAEVRWVREGIRLNPGGWVGGALPPGLDLVCPTLPHSLPQCNPNPILPPTSPWPRPRCAAIARGDGRSRDAGRPARAAAASQARAQSPRLQRLLRRGAPARGTRGGAPARAARPPGPSASRRGPPARQLPIVSGRTWIAGSASTSRAPRSLGAHASRPPWAATAAVTPGPARAPGQLVQRGGQSRPLVGHLDPHLGALRPPPRLDAPPAVLDRVGEQIAHRLGETDRVGADERRRARPGERELAAALRGRRAPRLDRVAQD